MDESTNSAGESQASESGGESRTPTIGAIERVASLLRGEEPGKEPGDGKPGESQASGDGEKDGDSTDGKPGESQKRGKPKTIDELAEALGVKGKDLFDIKLNLGNISGTDGESRTLGELKDLATEHGQFEVDRLQFEETRTKREKEFLKAQGELSELISMLPKSAIKPELIQAIVAKREQTLEREKGLTLTAIPDWTDEAAETTDRAAMQKHLSAYGYRSNYLDSITDHRTLKYIRDNMQREARIERVLAQVKEIKKPGHGPSGKPSVAAPAKKAGGRMRSTDQQVAAVAELLNTG